ncbi:MAG: phosphonoacetaldehyde hydrolase [Cereibacter sp.]|nr:phosphonoacetaldehyde hydrolase [Cereibacter sp.]
MTLSVLHGPVTTVIFDWAGTVLDFGCIAPVNAFRDAFAQAGVEISEAEARLPMGAAKREHVALILAQEGPQARWQARHGRVSDEADVDGLYAAFLHSDAENVAIHSGLIPGALETIAALRARGIAIGSTTGYPRSVMQRLMPLAAAQGYSPDHCTTVSDVVRGRPYPDMVLDNALALGAASMRSCVVVDDSPTGLTAGRAAGAWAVGIVASGNEVGLSLEAWQALSEAEREERRAAATAALRAGGAQYVIDTIADLPPVIAEIDRRLADGEAP